jgi:hypothetical protein
VGGAATWDDRPAGMGGAPVGEPPPDDALGQGTSYFIVNEPEPEYAYTSHR